MDWNYSFYPLHFIRTMGDTGVPVPHLDPRTDPYNHTAIGPAPASIVYYTDRYGYSDLWNTHGYTVQCSLVV